MDYIAIVGSYNAGFIRLLEFMIANSLSTVFIIENRF